MNKKYVIKWCLLYVVILVILLLIVRIKKYCVNDYSLVFDKYYYACNNPDVVNVIGDDEKNLLKHFLDYGMQEGRRGIENFDVAYYKANNPDLSEIYGENLTLYYEHYIKYGHSEGRKGATDDIIEPDFDCELHCKLKDSEHICLSLKLKKGFRKEKYYIFEMPAYENDLKNAKEVAEVKCNSNNVIISKNRITDKYVVLKKENDEYKVISNIAYIENPEILSKSIDNMNVPYSKKGLQINIDNLDDVENLEPSYVFFNLFIEDFLVIVPDNKQVIQYDYQENTYYFNKKTVEYYDKVISRLTQDKIVIVCSILSKKVDGFDFLYYPEISMDTGAAFYAINTSDFEGLRYFESFISFISSRYNGQYSEYGLISKYTIGNEVNESGTYNYMGEKNINSYLDEYTRTFRVAYNLIKSNNSNVEVYVPLEPWWGIGSNNLTYGGREFLTIFNNKIKESGNINWGIGYHAYSYPLSDPKVLNDCLPTSDENYEILPGYITKDTFDTITITMQNIDVLINFMKQKNFLTSDNKIRSIILSEQGYTSNSNVYGKSEANQAASLVYSYYKTEMNDNIDAFIYFLQKDDENASLGNSYYQFGLSYLSEEGKIEKNYHMIYLKVWIKLIR